MYSGWLDFDQIHIEIAGVDSPLIHCEGLNAK